jgi:hypothetical protein
MTASQPPQNAGPPTDPPQPARRTAGPPTDPPQDPGRALPGPWHAANEGLAFLLELEALAGLAWWGADTGSGRNTSLADGPREPREGADPAACSGGDGLRSRA